MESPLLYNTYKETPNPNHWSSWLDYKHQAACSGLLPIHIWKLPCFTTNVRRLQTLETICSCTWTKCILTWNCCNSATTRCRWFCCCCSNDAFFFSPPSSLLLMLLMLNWNRGESPSRWAEPQNIAFLFFFTTKLAVLRNTVLQWRRKTEGQGVQWLEKQRRPWGKWAQAASMRTDAIPASGSPLLPSLALPAPSLLPYSLRQKEVRGRGFSPFTLEANQMSSWPMAS